MITFALEELIQRPVEEVWNFLAHPENGLQWQPAVIDQRYTSSEPHGVGSRGLNVRQVMGRRIETTWEITEYAPNHGFALKSTSGPVSYVLSYAFEAVDGGTHLSFHFQGDPKGVFKIAEPLLASTIKKEYVEDHARLKTVLERQAS